MLFSNILQKKFKISEVQFHLACSIGTLDGSGDICDKVLRFSTKTIEDSISNGSTVRDVCAWILFESGIDGLSKYGNMFEYLYDNVCELMTTHNSHIGIFTNTVYCKNIVKRSLKSSYNGVLTQDVMVTVYNDFRQWCMISSGDFRYTSNADNIAGWVINALKYYMKDSTRILKYIYEHSSEKKVNGESDTTYLDFQKVKYDNHLDEEFNFAGCASKLVEASAVAYMHNSNIVYDIYSNYIIDRVEAVLERFIKKLGTLGRMFTAEHDWGVDGDQYARSKVNFRNIVVNSFKKVVDTNFNHMSMIDIYNEALSNNNSIHKTKDGVKMFSSDIYETKDEKSTGDIIEMLYDGHLAMRGLIEHLENTGVNPLAIDPRLFRNFLLPRRFHTVNEFLILDKEVKELMTNDLSDNDKVYNSLCTGKELATIKDFIKSSNVLTNIKDFVDNTDNFDSVDTYDTCKKLLNKYSDVLSYITILGDNVYLDHKSSSNALFFYKAKMKEKCRKLGIKYSDSLLLKHVVFSNYRECKFTDRFNIRGTADIKNMYETHLHVDLFCIKDMDLQEGKKLLNNLCKALYIVYKSKKYNKLNVYKLCFAYIATLEHVMALEGHQVVEHSIMFKLPNENIKDTFNYLDEKELNKRIFAISACLFIMTGKIFDVNDNRLLYSAVGVCKAVQKFFEIILETLAIGSNRFLERPFVSTNIVDKYKNDGEFSALVRVASKKYILMYNDLDSSISSFDFVEHLNIICNVDKNLHNKLKTDVINCIVNIKGMMPDIFTAFGKFISKINQNISIPKSEIRITSESDKILAESARTLDIMNASETDKFTLKLSILLKKCKTDQNGYVMYNDKYFTMRDGERVKYLHDTGFFVRSDGDISRVGIENKNIIRELLEVNNVR